MSMAASSGVVESGVLGAGVFWWAKRVRVVAAVLALLCFAGLMGTESAVVGAHRGVWVAAVTSGCLEVGQDPTLVQEVRGQAAVSGTGALVGKTYGRGYGAAWRPFRAGGAKYSRLVFPLWQPMLVMGVVAGFAHGVVIGGRRADRGQCAGCGYDVRSIAAGGRCPECGRVKGASGANAGESLEHGRVKQG